MPVAIPIDIKESKDIDTSECTHPAGHCYGSDGGSGTPENLKVASGRGGEQEVWTLSNDKNKIEKQEIYSRCQYCLKYSYVRDKEEKPDQT